MTKWELGTDVEAIKGEALHRKKGSTNTNRNRSTRGEGEGRRPKSLGDANLKKKGGLL
jgi:hypothetical protein